MTKEIKDILTAYEAAKALSKEAALATVVKVEGSSYRLPGARMLITDDGELTGAISGGCLEGDALRKALLAIDQKKNKLITYNTGTDEGEEIGLQLGCNGIVHILFEYIDAAVQINPIVLLQQLEGGRQGAVVGSVFSLDKTADQIGTVLFYRENKVVLDYPRLKNELVDEVQRVLNTKKTVVIQLQNNTAIEAILDYITPPVALVVAGAGNDTIPLVKMATLLGWDVTVIDGRLTHATKSRFPEAKNVIAAKPENFLQHLHEPDEQTFVVLMTHNYKYDLKVLKELLKTDCSYIGILGPKSKLYRMFEELTADGIEVTEKDRQRIYGPIGLDIGAETSEEIALSVLSEIKAVLSNRNGNFLKLKKGTIHSDIKFENSEYGK
jgi:xanthine dehydrogenase accessory factor